jgi:hypothetical protein
MRALLVGSGLVLLLANVLGWSVDLVASNAFADVVSAVLVVMGALALWAALDRRRERVLARRVRRER